MRQLGRWGLAVLTGVAGVAGGCGGDVDGAVGWQAVRDTVGDTVVVRTVAGSVWGDTARLVEELRIGSLDGEDAYVLGDPVALAVGNGAVYVLDAQVPAVRAYDTETGAHLYDIGREGGGPGEYGSPDGIAVLPDGRVLVRDPRTVRINVYAPDGTPLDAWRHPNGGGYHTYRRLYVDTAGTAYATTLLDWGVPPWEWDRALIGVSSQGAVTDTILEPGLLYERADLTAASRGNGASRRQVPFTGERVWSFSPHGYTIGAITSRYAVYLFRPEGVLRVEREPEPVPVLPAEAEERRARITAELQRQYGGWRWNGPEIPETKPPIRTLFADDDGRVWVVVSRPGRPIMTRTEAEAEAERAGRPVLRYEEPPAFEVFDADGRFLGPVSAPAQLRTDPSPVVRGAMVWGIERDALGVPTVVRYRLVP